MRIAILYNLPSPSRYDLLGETQAVCAVNAEVNAVEGVLKADGHDVSLVGLTPPLSNALATLANLSTDLVFNLFEGFDGRSETEWQIAQALEATWIPFTGASSKTLALCLDKAKTKDVLVASHLPTAPFQILDSKTVDSIKVDFPVIVKPLREDASHGLNSDSVVHDVRALAVQVLRLEENYGGPVLVESFLPGREFNASVLGGRTPRVLPPTEIEYTADMPGVWILTFAAKWLPQDPAYRGSVVVCPAQIPDSLCHEIEGLAVAAYKAVGSPPYARVDMRADVQGKLHILEVNPNPDLDPEVGMARQSGAAGMTYTELIKAIVGSALEGRKFGRRRVASHATR